MSIVKFLSISFIVNIILVLAFMAITGIGKEVATALIVFAPIFLTWVEMKAIILIYDLLTKKK